MKKSINSKMIATFIAAVLVISLSFLFIIHPLLPLIVAIVMAALFFVNKKRLWYAIALTLPFLSTRFGPEGVGLTFTLLLFVVLGGLLLIQFLTKDRNAIQNDINFGSLKYFMGLFLWMIIGLLYSADTSSAINTVMKFLPLIVISVICSTYFPKDGKTQNKLFSFILVVTGIYILYLSYFYLYKHGLSYISIHTDIPSERNKNLLGIYLALVSPVALMYIVDALKKRTLLNFKTLTLSVFSSLTIVGLVLTSSRGAWVSFAIGLLMVIIFNKYSKRKLILVSLLIVTSLAVFSNDLQKERAMSLFSDDTSYYGANSSNVRNELNNFSIQLFSSSPIIGVGTNSYEVELNKISSFGEKPSHNEYLKILAENGLIGAFMMMTMVFSLFRKSVFILRNSTIWYEIGIAHATISLMVYLLFINGFDNYILWMTFGMCIFFNYSVRNRIKNNIPQQV